MKLNHFKFQDGKVFWLPEYPDKLTQSLVSYSVWEQYEKAIAQSLASAIEVDTKGLVVEQQEQYTRRPMLMIMVRQHPFVYEELKDGKVYSAECEMEVNYQVLIQKTWHKTPKENYDKWSSNGTEPHYRQIAHLKPKEEIPAANSHDMKDEDL